MVAAIKEVDAGNVVAADAAGNVVADAAGNVVADAVGGRGRGHRGGQNSTL